MPVVNKTKTPLRIPQKVNYIRYIPQNFHSEARSFWIVQPSKRYHYDRLPTAIIIVLWRRAHQLADE